MVVSCFSAAQVAHAGSWLIQQEGSGTKSTTPASSQNGSWDMPNVPAQVVPRPFNPSVNTGVGASATTQGSITLICTWQPSSGNDPVPAVLTLKVTPTAVGTVSYHQSGGSASYPSVSNGHGDEAVKTLSGPTNNLMTKRTEASGSWLKQVKTNGQNTLRLKVDQLSSSFASVVQGTGTAYVMVAAQFDPRSVKIDSASFFDGNGNNWQKENITGPHLPSYDPRKENKPNPDGSLTIDAAAQDSWGIYWYGGGQFTANTQGITIPRYKWKWSGDGVPIQGYGFDVQAEIASNKAQIDVVSGASLGAVILGAPTYGMDLGSAQASNVLGKSSTIKVDVTDDYFLRSDNAIATDTLNIRWHYPYENWREASPATNVDIPPSISVDAPGYCNINETIGYTWNDERVYIGNWVRNGAQTVAALGWVAAQSNLLTASLAAVAGVAAGNIGGVSDRAAAVFNDCWDDPRSTWNVAPFTNGVKDDSLRGQYRMTPVKFLIYREQYWEGEEYGSKGYVGSIKKATRVIQEGAGYSLGIFTKVIITPPPTPPPA